MNPYRPDPWNNEMDDKYVGWAHGFAGPAARIFRSNAYEQGFNEGKKKRIECVFVCAKCGYGPVEHGLPEHVAYQCVYEPQEATR